MRRFLWVSLLSALLIAVSVVLPDSAWTSLGGLPSHPLVVHGIVVLIPLLSLVVLVGLFWTRLLRSSYLVVIAGFGVLAAGTIAAKKSGEQLAELVGMPEQHEQLGTILVPVAIALFVSFTLFALFAFVSANTALAMVFAVVVGVLAGASIPLTFLVGHSGAESVWGEVVPGAELEQDEPDENERGENERGEEMGSEVQTTTKPVPTQALREITSAEVSEHRTAEDCWTIVSGAVYDVTKFVGRHPGGQSAIAQICGVDGTDLFTGQHGGQGGPQSELSTLKIGVLAP